MTNDLEIHLFHEGTYEEAYLYFGSHVNKKEGSTTFRVFAPEAKKVYVLGSFNNWKKSEWEAKEIANGVWQCNVPRNLFTHVYKYEIHTKDGAVLLKADPFATHAEVRPETASVVYGVTPFQWTDEEWLMKKRTAAVYEKPLSIYEVHLGSWKIHDVEKPYQFDELITTLIPYVKEMGFTHIELLPVYEHPFDRSWGYQATGYYAPSSRFGSPDSFKRFINACHKEGIGVIMDWVPGHFCKDAHGLSTFDGSNVFEYQKENDRENWIWGTANFDLGKGAVRSFLLSNAIYWLKEFHVDGFRIDAVSNMIYWPNTNEESANKYAQEFLQLLNSRVFQYDCHTLMMAEDSSDWPGVTHPVSHGGLGFNYKWNMGWMNDVLKFMETPHHEKGDVHHLLTFSMMYAFSENFLLPLSHDEVVHGKKSIVSKMLGDYEEKFAQARLLYTYMFTHPGKKLMFMGAELGMFSEWKDMEQLDWNLLDFEMHQKFHTYFKELLHLYKECSFLFEKDHHSSGFKWIDVHNNEQSILSYIRRGKEEKNFGVVICNFREIAYESFTFGVPLASEYELVWSTDWTTYGGDSIKEQYQSISVENDSFHGQEGSVTIKLPAFSAIIIKPKFKGGLNDD
ncbi:1,4-alpha-glucan branching protein GlgB [Mangrovibacillus cuniculi]|uniref:1,4-alpha-glucan branching enzyme n=1 Tax=Mangrovibacillus cuniculi TaxID=2593652 RepID=A0A7S8CCA0_9BACI|nr:1,4-alpha-glucan branching protein GlgB [Mangrovibacillus cuniculi]QPC47326.1 1,4-alpha-glucan branching protein GlgB [Mangrovibacillus cuniculi]